MLLSPNVALLLFAAIVIVAGCIAWYMGAHEHYDKGSFHTFIAILAGLGIFVTFLFYYNVIQLQAQQQALAAIQEFSRLSDSLLNSILDEIKEASVIIPNFVLSITPLTNTICMTTAPEDPVNPQTCTEKMVLSYRIFSLWQDVIISDNFIHFNPVFYITNFLQRANSSQLYQEWTVSKINFRTDTQTFGDLLFEYGLPITNQTPDEYTAAAQKLINDPRYTQVFQNPCHS